MQQLELPLVPQQQVDDYTVELEARVEYLRNALDRATELLRKNYTDEYIHDVVLREPEP